MWRAALVPALCAAAARPRCDLSSRGGGRRARRAANLTRIPPEFVARARELMAQHPLIDGHNDLPSALRYMVHNEVLAIDLNAAQPRLDTDIPRMREGLLGGQFWSVWVGCGTQGKDAVRQTMEQIDVVQKLARRYPETFRLCATAAECEAAFHAGGVASLLGIEGGHQIDSSMATLRLFYAAGVRYMTLTHTCSTPWATSAGSAPNGTYGPGNVGCEADADCHPGACAASGVCAEAQLGGLEVFGVEVVREMNRLGMLVDVSHVSPRTQTEAITLSTAPVIYSHSNALALCPHPRNAPDEALLRLGENGGVIMVVPLDIADDAGWDDFVCGPGGAMTSTLQHLVDHVDYIAKGVCPHWAPAECGANGFPGIGIEHVGIGADFDGGGGLPGIVDVSEYPNFAAELLRRGYSDAEVVGVIGGNVLRALRGAEAESARLSTHFPNEEMQYPSRQCRSSN